ncbi:16566_t:CDS:1 [Gigaspora rosea]|nr:16566_t:CDS:1 [Gigaspora rosea]
MEREHVWRIIELQPKNNNNMKKLLMICIISPIIIVNVYQPFAKYDTCNCKRDNIFMEELKNLYKEIDLLSKYDIEKIKIINSMYESFSIEHREDIRKAIIKANIRLLYKNESYLIEYEPYHTFVMRIRKQHKPNDIMEYICDCSITLNHVKQLLDIYKRRLNIERRRNYKLNQSKKIFDGTSDHERRLLEKSVTKNIVNLLEYRPKSFITDQFVDRIIYYFNYH